MPEAETSSAGEGGAAGRADAPGLAPVADAGDIWLFGYGSLIWRPDVEFLSARPAVLRGYRRRFWQRSTDHRGTAEAPGRVVTLVPEEGGRVVGMAYHLVDAAATLARIDVREQQGYTRRVLPVELEERRAVAAVVYVADPENPYFVGGEALAATAQIIATAHGPSGPNLEYARRLVASLGELAALHGERLAFRPEDFAYERELLELAERR